MNLDFNGFGVIHRRDHVTYDTMAQTLVLEELARVSGAALPFPNDFLNLQIMEEFAGPGSLSSFERGTRPKGGWRSPLLYPSPRAVRTT